MSHPSPTEPPIVLALHGAAFGYGTRTVVSGLDVAIRAGEVVAVLGPNGSGKSTLVKGVLGLATNFAGRVEVLGMPRTDFREHARLGYVPQRHTLAAGARATVWEIVAAGRLTRRRLLSHPGAGDRAAIRRAIELVGLADRERSDVAALSGGQQRRVLIARALAGEPDILLMDEPTAGVDASAQHVLADVLARLVATGVTLVVVTHELAALAELVTRVIVVEDGRVAFDGSRDEFASASGVVHDHDAHHHDSELDQVPSWVAAVPAPLPRPLTDRSGGTRG